MAKLNWVLLSNMYSNPLLIHSKSGSSFRPSTCSSEILLCTYHAFGRQYYKYTYDGVNVFFYNLFALVAFSIVNAVFLKDAFPTSPFSQPFFLFISELISVVPLAYFIGMAVSSISAQSSYGMAAVLNATFGSIVEVILYIFALKDGKGALVEGSIIGSILFSTLLLPGVSMFAGGVRIKEQQFNLKSAGVTSTLLIMSVIGAFTPTMFHLKYGSFSLNCSACDPTLLHGNVSGKL
jgi:Ca2+:H+ antiporter